MGLLDFSRRKKHPGDSQADFAQMLMAWIREQGVSDAMRYDADNFRIVIVIGSGQRAFDQHDRREGLARLGRIL
ncbi:hypothetical protein [Pseudoduganella violacea]|uniref:Uncharacterized protein n=1 Tax=Pseudoduganella violacea TaxID=1715466 RepID=A0A7W5FSV4_9BURK|nr:hypothetical protein [Pseudoduganella violacea]MBB3118145.1 hypothetical protein [Pseudoduganella violacea]